MDKHLHIVSYAIPYPPDYGGIIDVFYRIKSLHQLGVKIHLHCFDYLGSKNPELDKLCVEIHYYKRKMGFLSQISLLPFIVNSRKNKHLLENLVKVEAPILFDGLHCTYWLNNKQIRQRKTIVRAHNIEHEYYAILGTLEKRFLKRVFFKIESLRLKFYEKKLKTANHIACVSLEEFKHFNKLYRNAQFIPSSHPFFNLQNQEGKGEFIIFHGNLMVSENEQAAFWLLENVIPKIPFNVIFTGKNPSDKLIRSCNKLSNVKIIPNPDQETMRELIKSAHINLLPVFQNCGLRLKLLYALYSGRFCLVNSQMVEGTSLASVCTIANNEREMIEEINRLMKLDFTNSDKIERERLLTENYNNEENAKKLIKLMFNELD